jgi:DNA mismatch endonuclease (patch repair protein)
MPDIYTRQKRHEIMSNVRGRDTQPEKLVRAHLRKIGIRYRANRKDLPGRPDIVVPKAHTVIFVHGCFWHGHECAKGRSLPKTNQNFWAEKISRNLERDKENVRDLETRGWKVLIVWECEARHGDALEASLSRLLRA